MRRIRTIAGYLRHLPCHPQWLLEPRGMQEAVGRLSGKVLDVGCADRWVESQCRSGVEYIGLDLPITGKGLYAAHPDIFADAAHLPLTEASIDAIVCLEVLEHVSDPRGALAEFARVLKPGGVMIFSMPFMYPIHDIPHDFQRLTQYGLKRDLNIAGFDIVKLRKTGHAVRAAALLLSLALVGGIYARRRWYDYLRMPLAAIGVLVINILAILVAWVTPDWDALGTGYDIEARRR